MVSKWSRPFNFEPLPASTLLSAAIVSSKTKTRNQWLAEARRAGRRTLYLFLLAGCGIYAWPAGQEPVLRPLNQQSQTLFDGLDEADPAMAARRMRALNLERQKSMVADTDRLLQLVKALHAEIEKGNPDALTVVQLREVSEIEKLARNVRQKMSLSFAGAPAYKPRLPQHFPQ